jgi:hypothetical protein
LLEGRYGFPDSFGVILEVVCDLEFGGLDDLIQNRVLLLAFTDQAFDQLMAPGLLLDKSLKFVFEDSLGFVNKLRRDFAHDECFDRREKLESADVGIDVRFVAPRVWPVFVDARLAILPFKNYLALLALEAHSIRATVLVLNLPTAVITEQRLVDRLVFRLLLDSNQVAFLFEGFNSLCFGFFFRS